MFKKGWFEGRDLGWMDVLCVHRVWDLPVTPFRSWRYLFFYLHHPEHSTQLESTRLDAIKSPKPHRFIATSFFYELRWLAKRKESRIYSDIYSSNFSKAYEELTQE